ncbi:hypothetical protein, partial [Enterobacter cloacae complex sp. IR53030]
PRNFNQRVSLGRNDLLIRTFPRIPSSFTKGDRDMKKTLLLGFSLISFSVLAASYQIQVPTDSKATYTVLDKGSQGPLRTITTKREGSSGVTFSQRIYNCEANEVKYLGSGESLEEMKNSKADPSMSPIVSDSIAYYLGREACK